jgi:hypothetical protein
MWLSLNNGYSVSKDGYVMNERSGRILSPQDDRRGYARVDLHGKHKKIHYLVASRWLPAPTEEGLVIDHIDGNRLNNDAANLRWCSQSVNMRNTVKHRKKEKTLSERLNEIFKVGH